ncbi:hypothetical protein CF133_10420, partial [Aeromonas salmonicida]|uniref:ead/Ea22-like family protein n=3 Tax=Aeromonas salmonicida TaxID=645 RepID=UPI001F5037AA
MNIDLNELLALAEKATPGPWRYQGFPILEPTGYFGVQVAEPSNILFEDVKKQDAEFITAADPSVVADIIKRLQIAEALNETTLQTLTPQSEGLILVTVNENLMRLRSETGVVAQ